MAHVVVAFNALVVRMVVTVVLAVGSAVAVVVVVVVAIAAGCLEKAWTGPDEEYEYLIEQARDDAEFEHLVDILEEVLACPDEHLEFEYLCEQEQADAELKHMEGVFKEGLSLDEDCFVSRLRGVS